LRRKVTRLHQPWGEVKRPKNGGGGSATPKSRPDADGGRDPRDLHRDRQQHAPERRHGGAPSLTRASRAPQTTRPCPLSCCRCCPCAAPCSARRTCRGPSSTRRSRPAAPPAPPASASPGR